MGKLAKKLKEKFDWDVDTLPAYVDQESDEILADLIHSSNLVSRIQVMEEVKGSEKIKLLSADLALQSADTCGWNADGTVEFKDKTITTERLKVQADFCNEDLNATWAQMLLAIGANRQDREMPLEAVITAYAIKQAQLKNQNLMFNGDTTSLNPDLAHYDGFIKLWDADANLNVANSTETSITATNAFDVAITLYNAIPSVLFDNGVNVEIICSRETARLIIAQVYNDKDYQALLNFTETNGELSFVLPTTGITVRSYPQIPNGKMYAVPYTYMFFGTDLTNDVDGFEAKYNDHDEKLRFGVKWRSGIQYVYSEYFTRLELANS